MKILLGQAIVFFVLGVIQGIILTSSYRDKQDLRAIVDNSLRPNNNVKNEG